MCAHNLSSESQLNAPDLTAPEAINSQVHVTVGGPGADIGGLNQKAIQAGIDYVAALGGGTVELLEGEYLIEDAVRPRNNTALRGQGAKTILKKNGGHRSLLTVDADMHETAITVEDASGFEVGMGVTIGDNDRAQTANMSVRTIISKWGNVLGFGQSFDTTQMVKDGAFAQTTFPVIYLKEVENVIIDNLTIDGNRANNPLIDDWADGGIYILFSRQAEILNCTVYEVSGDGISLNTGDDVHIENCVVHDIARLGIHIGTGSQRTIVKNCKIRSSGLSEIKGNSNGLHLCYSAQHGIYDGNEIYDNHYTGISIGHKDGDNQFINNIIRANGHVGITYRKDTYRAYNNIFKDCLIEDNGHYGFYITGDAHHTTLEKCTIHDTRPEDSKTQRVGVFVGNTEDVVLNDCNVAQNCEQDIVRDGNVTSEQ